MYKEVFKITFLATFKISLIAGAGFIFRRKKWLSKEGLNNLSFLVINLTLPLFIFSELLKKFRFNSYPEWWFVPFLSLVISVSGYLLGKFICLNKKIKEKKEFLALMSFQNSGYLPLSLVSVLFPLSQDKLFIYIFLYLVGFNLLIWSLGPYILSSRPQNPYKKLINTPVLATLFSLIVIFLRWEIFLPSSLLETSALLGRCTIPLGLFVVGANLAETSFKFKDSEIRDFLINLILGKLFFLPLLGLWVLTRFRIPYLIAVLVMIQTCMPPATSLSLIANEYIRYDKFVSKSIFFSHLIGLFSIPLFLSIFFFFFR